MIKIGTGRDDRGSVLMLVPAGFLILIMLAAITIDYSHLFLAQRQVATLAEGMANDAVTSGIDEPTFRLTGDRRLDPNRVKALCDRRAQRADRSLTITSITCVAVNDAQVEVAITARIDYIFVKVVPGAPRTATVNAHATATASPPASQTP